MKGSTKKLKEKMNRLFIGIILLATIFSCGSESDSSPAPATGPSASALQNDSSKLRTSSIDKINEEIVNDPKNASLYHERAYANFYQGNVDEAISDVKVAIELDGDNADYYFTKGYFFHSQLMLSEAKTAFQQALERDFQHKQAHFFLAKIYTTLARPNDKYKDNYKKAFDELSEVIKIDPSFHQAYFWRGQLYQELADSGSALRSFKTAAEIYPDYYDAYIRIGLLYAAARNPKAEDAYKTALEIRPNSTEASFNLAVYYQNNERFDDAENYYNQTIQKDSLHAISYHNLGYMYTTFDTSYTKAQEYLHRALFYNSGQYLPDTYVLIGETYIKQGRCEMAREPFQNALKYRENYSPAIAGLNKLDQMGC
jgi:tetratricopeptide (TPR) repeat protein